MLNIEIIPCLKDNYSYLLYDQNTNTVVIIDPSDFKTCDEIISKKYKKLDYILNTHHHFDHVEGNQKLKEKYKSKILGSEIDKDRIPGIDIALKEKENFTIGNTSFEVIFVPGHTKGHIAFYFKNEKIIFTGDTLFSLGCGRVFEGTNEQMFNSLNKLKRLPIDTKIYCGHEYTLKNSMFCKKYEENNKNLKKKIIEIEHKLKNNLPTIPSTIKEELACNIFLRAKNLEDFSKLRDLKDNF